VAHVLVPVPSPAPIHTTVDDAAERWRRWEQRGFDNEVRFARRARLAFGVLTIVAVGVAVLALWGA
jgi:hypothetical protein